MQQRRVIWMAALLLSLLGVACGDDASGGGGSGNEGGQGGRGDRDASASGDSGARPDSGADPGGGSGGDDPVDEPGPDASMMPGTDEDAGAVEDCGQIACEPGMCCYDAFSSTCGAPIGARGCIMPPPPDASSDARCPPLNIMNFFMLPSCCTPDGQCGINAAQFGAGCIELGEFAMLAQAMAGGNFMLTVPPPQACE